MAFKPSAPGVFINYRRTPDLATAGRLFDTLKTLLPDTTIFMDVDSLPAGHDFVAELDTRISQCDLFLLVIGPGWMNASDEHGVRRLGQPEDFVRFEIETALRCGRQIIPVLIGTAIMPTEAELPLSITQITRLNAVSVRHENFQRDCQMLADKIKPSLTSASTVPPERREELEAFRSESRRAQELVAQRPPGWEYLLVAELWGNYLKPPLRRLSDMASGLYAVRHTRLRDDETSLAWIQEQLGASGGAVRPLGKLMSIELMRACGEPGVAGDPREILHVCKLMQRAAQNVVDWEENVRSYEVTEKFQGVHDLLLGIAARQLEKLKDLPAVLSGAVEYGIAHPDEPHEVRFMVEFDFPDGWVKKFNRALRRAQGSCW